MRSQLRFNCRRWPMLRLHTWVSRYTFHSCGHPQVGMACALLPIDRLSVPHLLVRPEISCLPNGFLGINLSQVCANLSRSPQSRDKSTHLGGVWNPGVRGADPLGFVFFGAFWGLPFYVPATSHRCSAGASPFPPDTPRVTSLSRLSRRFSEGPRTGAGRPTALGFSRSVVAATGP
jgi:hypothetical protein